MQYPDRCREVMRLLDGLTDQQVRAVGIEALRRWRKRALASRPSVIDRLAESVPDAFAMHGDFGLDLAGLLLAADTTGRAQFDANQLKEVFIDDDAMSKEWMRGVVEFLWWLTRAGLAVELVRAVNPVKAYPGQDHGHSTGAYPITMRLTRRGVRLLDGSDDNPMLPGFLDRISARCPGLPDGAIALLVDARACFDHSLMRPAVVLMGVAYELVIERVVDVLVGVKGVLTAEPRETAKDRIKRIKSLLTNATTAKALLPHPDARTAAEAAYDFAETLRQRRNDAAHTKPVFDFDHSEETEEFLVRAGWHLPALWSLAV